ncbi:MAG: aminoacyl-histidine dipeptidase, partial [Candidatus Korarchaeota archaeon]|nr:aminoacyl-histidine dipeptidase [Candidatus Korarchaeota archaeon]NIW14436.1 beta-Ala-His dipeptidase [Candidatus Thorarchaeota archaeon]
MKLSKIEPTPVWTYFDEIRKIPRCSGNEEKIGEFLLNIAEKHDLKAERDEVRNVVIHKPASPGYTDQPPLIIQGHMDMVCEKNANVEHDFSKDPIPIKREGDWLTAKGTTLGADNGIGVALALALATEKEVKGRSLELLFTVDEERGLTGASQLKKDFVRGSALINLDSEEFGTIIIGCAGGGTSKLSLPLSSEDMRGGKIVELSVSGLKGGHSGLDIDKGRANAIKVLAGLMKKISQRTDIWICNIQGGDKHNAIPREASATFVIHKDAEIREVIKHQRTKLLENYKTEKSMNVEIHRSSRRPKAMFTEQSTRKVTNLLQKLPHGVIAWSEEIDDLVETSTNLATISLHESTLKVVMSSRSSVNAALEAIQAKIRSIGERFGAKIREEEPYPPWKPVPDSHLLQIAKETYKKLFGEAPKVEAIHAGLETGIIGEKFGNM